MTTLNAITSPAPALVTTVDSTGNLVIQTAGTNAVTYDTNQNATHTGSISSVNTFGFKNRIINGAMVIDQRNAGASGTAGGFTLDRWNYVATQASKGTWQQNAGSVTPPVGFNNYFGFTSSSAYSINSTDVFGIRQPIEGYNIADLGWGTANAKTITISFWVRSSLTGTFGLGLGNNDFSRAYPASYTISSANTWEQKTITVAGDTTGTWLTTNGAGVYVTFCLGYGSSYLVTANTWNAGTAYMPTGATSVVGTNGATFYITGVQLEVGSKATPFDLRDYGRELMMCQRYYQKSYPYATNPGTAISYDSCIQNSWGTSGSGILGTSVVFPVVMRAGPTLTLYDSAGASGVVTTLNAGAGATTGQSINTSNTLDSRMMVRLYGVAATGLSFMYTVSAEL